jgi:hypothetical protein
MKLKHIILGAGVLATLASVSAQAQTVYNNGDLFLGVRSLDTSNDYLIDIGPASNLTSGVTDFSIPGLTTDLNSIVGTGWQTNPDVFFSVFGGTVATSRTEMLYATNPNGPGNPWQTATTGESSIAADINTLELGYANNMSNVPSGLNSQAWEQADGDSNSYASLVGNGDSLGYFNPTIEGNASTTLDLEFLAAGSVHNAVSVDDVSLDGATNSIDFQAVPEPSTIATVLMGAVSLLAFRRRRRA